MTDFGIFGEPKPQSKNFELHIFARLNFDTQGSVSHLECESKVPERCWLNAFRVRVKLGIEVKSVGKTIKLTGVSTTRKGLSLRWNG